MDQSSTSVGINLRNKGLRNASGSLMKGIVKDATTKLSIGSIPSNFQTIIYHNNSTKAFGTSQKRFYQQQKSDLQKTDIPSTTILSDDEIKKNVSYSTKGYGPFIAKQQRNWIQKNQTPGPGRYEFTKTAQTNIKKHYKKPIFTRQNKQKHYECKTQKIENPGPGQYQVFQERSINNGWKSAFKSKMNRNTYLQNSSTPGPGYYDVKLNKTVQSIIKQVVSPEKESLSKKLDIFQKENKDQIPGPGSYDYEMPTFKPLYERIKISGNFMITKKDRFNNENDKFRIEEPEQQTPNVYSYKTKSSFDSEQRLLKWPCFMSQSKRTVFSGEKKLGPSFITASLQNRRNFHFNIKGGWF